MFRNRLIALIAIILVGTACSTSSETPPPAVNHDAAVWAVDFIRFLPGGEADYLRNIEGNWAQARDIALANGDVLSFKALLAEPDSTRDWDLILMTEYTDSASWSDREAIFASIFESDQYQRVDIGRPSSELREFAFGGIVFTPFVTSESR